MTTLSVPLTEDLPLSEIKKAVQQGFGANAADFARRAMKKYLEDLAVQEVLIAEKEPSLSGDLDELALKL